MQKPHFVAQGAALSKVIDVSMVVNWWLGFAAPRACFRCGAAASFLAPRLRRSVALGWPVG